VGGAIPGKYVPAVDRGVQEAAARGVLAGFPVVDFEAECFDGSYHTVDSSEQAFRVAGSLAFQQAVHAADPVVLEPVLEVEVTTPEEYLGDVIGDLNQRRGTDPGNGGAGAAAAGARPRPEAEMYRYATTLRSLTQGRGSHSRSFHAYEE
jgi:elongation factor G